VLTAINGSDGFFLDGYTGMEPITLTGAGSNVVLNLIAAPRRRLAPR